MIRYSGSLTTTGNSKAISLESALFVAHPEFAGKGKVAATVIAPGQMLVTIEAAEAAVGEDPIFAAFLAFVAEDMRRHPERLRQVTEEEAERVESLTRDVEVSDEDALPDDFTI